ncbi:MAG: lipopolysaccharide biosynthesis protein [Prevotella sp.]|nr:lipopolysaccharide biosynthesis protein [Prevotella sp.]
MSVNSRTVISSMLWKLMERFSSQLVSFVISIILARLLLPSDYGIIALIIVFINLATVIIDGGLNTALIQKKNADQTDFSTIFWFCLLVACLLYLLLFFCAPLIADFYDKSILIPLLRVLSLCLFFNSFNSIQRAYVSRNMMFRKLFYVNGIALIISGVTGIVMAISNLGVWALVGQTLISSVACCILMWFTVKWRPTIVFSKERFKTLFDFGWKLFCTNMIISLYENIRSLVIGKVYQPSTLAYFDRGKSLPHLVMSNVTTSINSVLLPTFAIEQDNTVRVKQMMRRSVQVSYLFVCPLLIGFIFTAKEIVLVLLTEKWLPCVPFIQIFCIAYLLMPIQSINITAIQSLGRSDVTLKLEVIKKIIEAIVLVVSFLINVYAVAWGIVVYNFICIFINLFPLKKMVNYGVLEQFKDVSTTLAISLIMGLVVFLIGHLNINNIVLLFIQVAVGALIYYGLCRMLRLESYQYVSDYIKSLRRKRA